MSVVFHIEDSDFDRDIFSIYFGRAGLSGFTLQSFETVEAACDAIPTQKPILIFLDSAVPPYRSFLRSTDVLRAAGYEGGIIILTGQITPDMAANAKHLGIGPVIDKFTFRAADLGPLVRSVVDT